MVSKRELAISVVATFCLTTALFNMVWMVGSSGDWDPWMDVDENGIIDMLDLYYVSKKFGTSGIPITKGAVEYDSGWINITDKCGQYFNITHSLNSTDIIVDMTGKTNLNGEPHQMCCGLTAGLPSWAATYCEMSEGELDFEKAYSVVQTCDGGFALAGVMDSGSSGGPHGSVLLVKTDWTGEMQWYKILLSGWYQTGIHSVHDVIQTDDEGYALAGYANESLFENPDAYLMKTDAGGNSQWIKGYGGTGYDSASSVIRTSDGGYAIAGYTASFGASSDFYLVKTDYAGEVLWQKMHGGIDDDIAYDVIQTEDEGYLLVGCTRSFGAGGTDVYLVKTDSNGNMDWNQTYGKTGDDCGYNVVRTNDGGYAMSCSGFASLIKTDSSGTLEWNRQYSESGASCVIETAEGGYALAANGSLVKVDSDGNVQWTGDYGGHPHCVVQAADGAYVCAGWKLNSTWCNDHLWLVRTEVECGVAWTGSATDTITLYRGATDPYWNFVRVRVWKPKSSP